MKIALVGSMVALCCACSSGLLSPPEDAAAPTDLAVSLADLAAPPGPDLSSVLPADMSSLPHDLTVPPDFTAFVCYDPGSSFPKFDRACGADVNCSIGIHQIDCCGSHAALGFNHAGRNAFDAAEAAFRVVCPANCKCAIRPTICDDGKTAPENMITVSCDKGVCTTHGI